MKITDAKSVNNFNSSYDSVSAPIGYYMDVKTPWGAIERCNVVSMPNVSGEKDNYASISRPKTNPHVKWSVFKIKT